jgi:hypothetical protein
MMTRSICELIEEVRPGLPGGFGDMDGDKQQAAVEGQLNLVKMRRNMVELVAGQKILLGEIEQSKADAHEVGQRLAENAVLPDDKQLPAHRVEHLVGRRMVSRARTERAQELIEQYARELELYRQILEAS